MNGITPNNLRKEGWIEIGTIDDGCGNTTLWSKNINGERYDLYYSDVDEDYIVVKHIAVVDSMKELNELITKKLNHIVIDTMNIQDCVLTNHDINSNVVKFD